MALQFCADRRRTERFGCPGDFTLTLRVKGTLKKFEVRALDYHRYGVAICSDRPYPTSTKLIADIAWRDLALSNLHCVVHNCTRTRQGYRCGLGFRTQSVDQFDRAEAEHKLFELERLLMNEIADAQYAPPALNSAER
ncbi:MAG: hypothetical protein O3A63_21515 [Proteobacteria bacterium]|nr:hypothetical protein [Pseudomonadota bacterium]